MVINFPSLNLLATLLEKFILCATVVLPKVIVLELVKLIAPAFSSAPLALVLKVLPPKTYVPESSNASLPELASSMIPALPVVPPVWLSDPCTNTVAVPDLINEPPPAVVPERVMIFVAAADVLNVFVVPSANVKDLASVAVVPV